MGRHTNKQTYRRTSFVCNSIYDAISRVIRGVTDMHTAESVMLVTMMMMMMMMTAATLIITVNDNGDDL